MTLTEFRENGWCNGSGYFINPNYETPKRGEFEEASYDYSGNCPADAVFNIRPLFEGGNGIMTVTAEGVKVTFSSYVYGNLTWNGKLIDTSDPQGEKIEISDGDLPEESAFTRIQLEKDHYHYLGSTYAEICDWLHGEANNRGFMEADGCYTTELRVRNAYLEMRRAEPDNTEEWHNDKDYCFGLDGWFGRIFDIEQESRTTVADVIRYFNATNLRKMKTEDEFEAPGLSTDHLICMDINLETSKGTKKVRLELGAGTLDSLVSVDTWARIYELN